MSTTMAKIKSIRKLEKKNDRYDLCVPSTSNFFANGILIHNTSQRYGKVLEINEIPLSWWKRTLNKLGAHYEPEQKRGYKLYYGTRRVEMNNKMKRDGGWYGSDEFRYNCGRGWVENLRKGEVVYGEIVGWTHNGAPIMEPGNPRDLSDKNFSKKYGDKMYYKYGCEPGTCKFFVYRICMVNEDGISFDLPWPQVQKRAGELGLECVPEFTQYRGIYSGNDGVANQYSIWPLKDIVAELVQGPDLLDPSHIREGVVVRVETKDGIYCLKEKSFEFKVMEQGVKDDDTKVDIEEAEDLNGQQPDTEVP